MLGISISSLVLFYWLCLIYCLRILVSYTFSNISGTERFSLVTRHNGAKFVQGRKSVSEFTVSKRLLVVLFYSRILTSFRKKLDFGFLRLTFRFTFQKTMKFCIWNTIVNLSKFFLEWLFLMKLWTSIQTLMSRLQCFSTVCILTTIACNFTTHHALWFCSAIVPFTDHTGHDAVSGCNCIHWWVVVCNPKFDGFNYFLFFLEYKTGSTVNRSESLLFDDLQYLFLIFVVNIYLIAWI